MNRKIRGKLAAYLMHKEINRKQRKAEVVPLSVAKTIGILYDATNDDDYELMKNYVKELRALTKDVVALGYFNQHELPEMRYMKLGMDLFTKKTLNWKLKPYSQIVTNFLDKDFDILICFNTERCIPISYIAGLANAKFKIGKYDVLYTGMFDFMIKPEGNLNLKLMIDQVNHYINLIKNEKHQEA